MFPKTLILFAAVYCHAACASYYHGPLAKPVVLKSGYLADTHEVAAAKNAHISALHKQSHSYGYAGDYGHDGSYGYAGDYGHDGNYGYGGSYGYGGDYGYNKGYGHGYSHDSHQTYHGPTAIPHVLHDGHIADTHEVAAAKAEHYAAVAKAKAHGGYGHDYSGQYATGYGGYHGYSQHAAPYHGPLAKPVVLKSGYLADTHEVAAAKHHHLEALHSGHHGSHYNHHY